MEKLPPVDRFTKFASEKISWLFLIAVVISSYEIFVDSVLGAPTIWVHDLTIMLSATGFLFGGAYAMQRRDHVRITVVYDLLPKSIQAKLDGLSLFLALGYLLALSYFATSQAIESIMLVERSGRAWDFPMPMVIRIAFSLGALLLTAQVIAHLVQLVRPKKAPTVEH